MIEVKNVSKSYGSFLAVQGISFKAERGQILGFLGPNGAGKTTTMRIITGFMPASSGTVEIDGLDIFANSLEARKRIGYLPETPPLYGDMRVESYLEFVARLRGVKRSAVDAAVDHMVDVCGLREMSGRICGQLSKGYRQRVGLAQALIHDPPVLVLDEPTIGLDPRQIHEIRELIRGLSGERTIVLSTHILPEVSQICDRVVIINDGHIVLEEQLANLPAGSSLEEVFLHAIAREGHLAGASTEETLEEVGAGRG
ncbi:MAG: ABC transporter ATP-binding protein [Candidatus Binataceae bacterium]